MKNYRLPLQYAFTNLIKLFFYWKLYLIQSKHQSFLLLAFTYTAIIVAYNSTLHDLFIRWTKWDQSQSHGLVIIGLSIFLYVQRLDLGTLSRKINPVPSIGIIFFSLCWALSAAISIDIIEQLCLFLIILLIHFSLFDIKYARPLLAPVCFLIFAIPIWDYLSPPMAGLSTIVVTKMLQISQLTAYIDGNSIFLPFGTIIIADGCSGLRYLLVALALASYLIITSRITVKKALLITAISGSLALLVNWIRIYAIVIIGYKSKMQSGLIEEHETLGWLLFIIVIMPIILIARRLSIYEIQDKNWPCDKRSNKIIVATILFFITGPIVLFLQSTSLSEPSIKKTVEEINFSSLGFTKTDIKLKSDPPPDIQLSLKYQDKNTEIHTTSGFYWQKKTGDPLVPYLSRIIDTSTRKIKSSVEHKLSRDIYAVSHILKHKQTGDLQLALYWFKVGDYSTPNYKLAKLLQFPAVIFGNNFFEYTKIEVKCLNEQCHEEREAALNVANHLINLLHNY